MKFLEIKSFQKNQALHSPNQEGEEFRICLTTYSNYF